MTTTRPTPIWLPVESDSPAPATARLRWLPWLLVALMTLIFAVGFSWLSLARHAAYQSHAFDLGNMDQAVWNTLHGHLFRFTDMEVGHTVLLSRFAIHVEPLLGLLAPFYLLHSGPETLLVVQAVVVALGAVPAYLLARLALRNEWLALVFPLAYLLHPSLQNAVLDDFHAVTMSACFLLWAMYFLYRGSLPGYAVSVLLAGSTKEEMGLLIAALSLALLAVRRWYGAFMSAVCGAGWFFISVLLVIPAANPAGHSPYLQRYRYLGHGLEGILQGALRRPHLVLTVLSSPPRVDYLDFLLHPLGYIPVLGLPVLLLAAPTFAINMLSNDPTMYSGLYQYSAEIVPYLIAAAVFATALVSRTVARLIPRGSAWLMAGMCLVVLLFSGLETRTYGFSPLAAGYLVPTPGPHQALEDRILRQIPAEAVVAAADEVEPHLSDRLWVYKLPTTHPTNGPTTQYIALDASIPSLPVWPYTLHQVALQTMRNGYGIRDARDGILLLQKGRAGRRLPGGFYSFVFQRGSRVAPQDVRWGALSLVGLTVHPRSLEVNRSRPAVSVETYWRASRRLPRGVRIVFYLSPVYTGKHPAFSRRWQTDWDSPTFDWAPLVSWPVGREIRAESLPLLPDTGRGKVDVAVGVFGAGLPVGAGADQSVPGTGRIIRLATIQVG